MTLEVPLSHVSLKMITWLLYASDICGYVMQKTLTSGSDTNPTVTNVNNTATGISNTGVAFENADIMLDMRTEFAQQADNSQEMLADR